MGRNIVEVEWNTTKILETCFLKIIEMNWIPFVRENLKRSILVTLHTNTRENNRENKSRTWTRIPWSRAARSCLTRERCTMLDNSEGLLIDDVTSTTVCNLKCCRGGVVATCARRWQDHQLGELIAQQKYQETKSTAYRAPVRQSVTVQIRNTNESVGGGCSRFQRVRKKNVK